MLKERVEKKEKPKEACRYRCTGKPIALAETSGARAKDFFYHGRQGAVRF